MWARAKTIHRHQAMTRMELIISISVLGAVGIVAALILPTLTTSIDVNYYEQKTLNKAKQLYLALAVYAMDHNGIYPHRRPDGGPLNSANQAFRHLFPDYISSEEEFYVRNSPWTPNPADDRFNDGNRLAAGENHWAYVPNQKREPKNHLPLIAEGFAKGTPGIYDASLKKRGDRTTPFGVVIIRNDGSGRIELVSKKDFRVYGNDSTGKKIDLFQPAPGWLRPDQIPLNPEG